MKKLFILFISLLITSPVLALNMNINGHLKGGEFVNIEFVSSDDNSSTANYFEYLYDLNSRMKRAWNPPTHARSSKTVFQFDMNPKRQTTNHICLLRTSGYKDVDQSAMATLRKDVLFKNLPDEEYDGRVTLKATFIRSVFARPDIKNNGTVIAMTKRAKKSYAKNIDMLSQKNICKQYVKFVDRRLKDKLILSDHPAMYASVFQFDILKDGSVSNIKITVNSQNKSFNDDVINKLSNMKFNPFPPALLEDKITLEYYVSNHLKNGPKNKF